MNDLFIIPFLVRYGEETIGVAEFIRTPDGNVVSKALNESRVSHLTDHPSGYIHVTNDRTSERTAQEWKESHADMTVRLVDRFEVPSTGPPPRATRYESIPNEAFVVNAPSSGTGCLVQVIGREPYIGQTITEWETQHSSTTHQVCTTPGGFAVWAVWDPAGSGPDL